jgi:glycosyltransferase 2 family protein
MSNRAVYLLGLPKVRRALQVGAIALVLFFFGLAFYRLAPDIAAYEWQFDPLYLGLAFALIFIRGPLGAYGWWAIVKQLGYRLPWRQSMRLVFHSSIAGFVPGGMWHAVSRVYLAERVGLPKGITTLSVFLETAFNALGAAVVALLSLLVWPELAPWLGLLMLAILLVFVFQPNLMFTVLNWLLVRVKREPIEVSVRPQDMLRLLWPYALNWVLFGLMSFALVAALYPQLPVAQAPALAGVFTAAWLVGYAAIFVPQGLIVREGIIIGFLTGALGLPAAVAAASAVLSRLWSMLGVLIWGAISSRL